jgi:hypothetical protein
VTRNLRIADLPPDTRLVGYTRHGDPILECTAPNCGRDYVGLRECPKCQGARLKAAEVSRPANGTGLVGLAGGGE